MARGFVLPLVGFGLLLGAALVRLAPRETPRAPVPRVQRIEVDPVVATSQPLPDAPDVAFTPSPSPASFAYVEPTLGAQEVLSLVKARLSEDVIVAVARATGRPFRATAEERDALRDEGASDVLLGRLGGAPESAAPAAPPAPPVSPTITVYAPVQVTVVQAPAPPRDPEPEWEPFLSTFVTTCVHHGRPGCCAPPDVGFPPIYQKEPFFKTHAPMSNKPVPTAEDVQRRRASREFLRGLR